MKNIKEFIKRSSVFRGLVYLMERYLHRYWLSIPPGHYYSPIPCPAEHLECEYFPQKDSSSICGIDFEISNQLELLRKLESYLPDYDKCLNDPRRFYDPENSYFIGMDAAVLFCFLGYLRPKQVVEVGSGYSSALQIDALERFCPDSWKLVCVDPFPQRLRSLLRDSVTQKVEVHEKKVQEMDLKVFSNLEPGDLLFIDSGHVVRSGGDVNWIFFEIIPRLKPGVFVHIHDIYYPFTYPPHFLNSGIYWSEAYLVRAALMNRCHKLILFNSMLKNLYSESIRSFDRGDAASGATSLYFLIQNR